MIPVGENETSSVVIGERSLASIFFRPRIMHSFICWCVSCLSRIFERLLRSYRRSLSRRGFEHADTWSLVSTSWHAGHFVGCSASMSCNFLLVGRHL